MAAAASDSMCMLSIIELDFKDIALCCVGLVRWSCVAQLCPAQPSSFPHAQDPGEKNGVRSLRSSLADQLTSLQKKHAAEMEMLEDIK